MANYEMAPNCCCRGLTCKQFLDSERQREEKRIHKFLLRLDTSFRTITIQILNMNLFLTIDNGYNMIIREERH